MTKYDIILTTYHKVAQLLGIYIEINGNLWNAYYWGTVTCSIYLATIGVVHFVCVHMDKCLLEGIKEK